MDTTRLQNHLADLRLGKIEFYPTLDSTNSEAVRMAGEGVQELSLVVADEQSAGRGRGDRAWLTPAGGALAFSLVLRPGQNLDISTTRLVGLGALGLCDVLKNVYRLPAAIKWPNDVLVEGRKLAGILVESQWQGSEIQFAVLGIGINVARNSVPSQGEVDFPATSVEQAAGESVDRWQLLKEVLEAILERLPELNQDGFIMDWENNLAFQEELVEITLEGAQAMRGRIQGLNQDGYLRLRLLDGEEQLIQFGDVRLRQVDIL